MKLDSTLEVIRLGFFPTKAACSLLDSGEDAFYFRPLWVLFFLLAISLGISVLSGVGSQSALSLIVFLLYFVFQFFLLLCLDTLWVFGMAQWMNPGELGFARVFIVNLVSLFPFFFVLPLVLFSWKMGIFICFIWVLVSKMVSLHQILRIPKFLVALIIAAPIGLLLFWVFLLSAVVITQIRYFL